MKTFYNTVLISFLAICYSCNNSRGKYEKYFSTVSGEPNVVSEPKKVDDYSQIYFPSVKLVSGETLTVTYVSRGCFHYTSETIQITRSQHSYLLTYKKLDGEREINVITDSTLDLSFDSSLELFSNKCKKSIKSRTISSDGEESMYIGTVYSLVVSDGLHFVSVPVEDVNPFNYLRGILDRNRIVEIGDEN